MGLFKGRRGAEAAVIGAEYRRPSGPMIDRTSLAVADCVPLLIEFTGLTETFRLIGPFDAAFCGQHPLRPDLH